MLDRFWDQRILGAWFIPLDRGSPLQVRVILRVAVRRLMRVAAEKMIHEQPAAGAIWIPRRFRIYRAFEAIFALPDSYSSQG